MPRYVVQSPYRTQDLGPWAPGETVDLLPHVAEWVNRDSPGTLALEEEVQERVVEKAPQDRQVRQAARRRTK